RPGSFHHGFPRVFFFGSGFYPSYYPSYGYSPPYSYSYGSYDYSDPYSYGSYDYSYPYSYDTYPYSYGGVAPSYADGTTSAAPPAATSPSAYPGAAVTAQADTLAHLTVRVPADARVWFDGAATTSTGPVRQFPSPPLTPGKRYSYEVRASWKEGG